MQASSEKEDTMRIPPSLAKAYSTLVERQTLRSLSIPDDLRAFLGDHGSGRIELKEMRSTGVALLRLNHPEKKNALCGRMILDLQSALTALETTPNLVGLVVHGTDNSFCAGMDLRLVSQTINTPWARLINDMMRSSLARLRSLPLVTLAALTGPAMGGGAELAVQCDFRLGTPSARIQFVQSRLGICTAWGGGARLAQVVGPTAALRILCAASVVDRKALVDVGLLEDFALDGLEGEAAVEAAAEWLRRQLPGVPEAIRAMKRIVANVTDEEDEINRLWGAPVHCRLLQKVLDRKRAEVLEPKI